MEQDLKWIKKHYGEKMMQLCRSLFSQILKMKQKSCETLTTDPEEMLDNV